VSAFEIFRVSQIEARRVDFHWAWAEEQAEAIAAHWARRKAERPAMFNGRVLMLCGHCRAGDAMQAAFFATDYANLVAWLQFGPRQAEVANGFSMGVLSTADGALVLGRMGAHTANAGQLYFPAGTPDLADVDTEGRVDLGANIVRELAEETGLVPAQYDIAPDWIVVVHAGQVAFLKEVRLAAAAEEAARRIREHIRQDPHPELADVILVRDAAEIGQHPMPDFLPHFLRWRLAPGGAAGAQPSARLAQKPRPGS
jgi:8-oxo-dGTP pyrophosphatase MutT (NUDIX family)